MLLKAWLVLYAENELFYKNSSQPRIYEKVFSNISDKELRKRFQ